MGVCQVLFSPRIGLHAWAPFHLGLLGVTDLEDNKNATKANPEPGGMREAILPFREKYFDVLNGLYYY